MTICPPQQSKERSNPARYDNVPTAAVHGTWHGITLCLQRRCTEPKNLVRLMPKCKQKQCMKPSSLVGYNNVVRNAMWYALRQGRGRQCNRGQVGHHGSPIWHKKWRESSTTNESPSKKAANQSEGTQKRKHPMTEATEPIIA